MGDASNADEFSEKFQIGGGREGGESFSIKIYVADFGPFNRAFLGNVKIHIPIMTSKWSTLREENQCITFKLASCEFY